MEIITRRDRIYALTSNKAARAQKTVSGGQGDKFKN